MAMGALKTSALAPTRSKQQWTSTSAAFRRRGARKASRMAVLP